MDFVNIANFNNKLSAEMVGNALKPHDIPFVIKSDEAIYGEGGVTNQVALKVPEDQAAKAKEILAGMTDELD